MKFQKERHATDLLHAHLVLKILGQGRTLA